MSPTARLVRDLIALPSVNPAFLPAGHPDAGEARVAHYVAAVAAAAGLDSTLELIQPDRPNVLARLTPSGPIEQRVLLVPHLDTVPAATPEDFQPRLLRGRWHGRGACDTKGSVAAMLTALTRVARQGRRPRHTEIVFAGVIDEENHQVGSRALAASSPPARLAIVGEPTRLQVVTAHKGNTWLRLETRGKAAHGCRPDLGRNAIVTMSRIVEQLESTYRLRLREKRHPLLGHATVNVGTITGGTQPNIVPDSCAITVDRRTLPGETDGQVRRELRALLRAAGVPARLRDLRGLPCPPLETSSDLPLVRDFMRAARQRQPRGVDYFCDAAVLAAAHIPSVVFGPGDIAQAHTRDEWVAVSQLDRATAILEQFLRGLA